MKKHIATFVLFIIYYLVWSFGIGDWVSISSEGIFRFFFIFFSVIPLWICIYWYQEDPEWLKSKTHEQKKTGITKYIGELTEELRLYGEAIDLQKRINEFKKQK